MNESDKAVMKQALDALYSDDVDQQSWAKTALMKAIAQPVQPAQLTADPDAHLKATAEDMKIYKGCAKSAQPVQPAPHNLQKRLEALHLYEEIAEHYAKCAVSPESLLIWVAEHINSKQAAKKAKP